MPVPGEQRFANGGCLFNFQADINHLKKAKKSLTKSLLFKIKPYFA